MEREYEPAEVNGMAEYLQLIQEPICRMSTISAIFKGFAATIVAGIAVIQYSTTNIIVLILSFLPVAAFSMLDVYYLILERKFRFLYDQVRENKHEVDFSMNLATDKNEIKIARARIRDCVKSPGIVLFYPLMVVILVVVCVLKINNEI